jgi:hypothetical protein
MLNHIEEAEPATFECKLLQFADNFDGKEIRTCIRAIAYLLLLCRLVISIMMHI